MIKKTYLNIEIAKTPSAHAQGLMFRTKMDDDSGMLFVFEKSQNLKFWGQNTYLPLDIAFISSENKIEKISYIIPLSEKMVTSDVNCNMAIETNCNFFSKNKIKVGDKINIVDNKEGKKIIFYTGELNED